MKKFFTYAMMFAMSVACMMSVSACSDDDNDGPDKSNGLVSPTIPAEGWHGNMTDGIATYNRGDGMTADTYLAFSFKGGRCLEGVCNAVFQSDRSASAIAGMLNDGTWLVAGGEDAARTPDRSAESVVSHIMAHRTLDATAMRPLSRASSSLRAPIPVETKDRVVYTRMLSVEGFTARDIKDVVSFWDDDYEGVPDRVLFGHYENGKYTLDNAQGIGMRCQISTGFKDGYCSKYDITLVFATEGWARYFYSGLYDVLDDYKELFGGEPQLTINGKTVVMKNKITSRLTQLYIEALISSTDWNNGCPVLYDLFG